MSPVPTPRTGTLPLLPSFSEQNPHCALEKGQEEATRFHLDSTAWKGVQKKKNTENSGLRATPRLPLMTRDTWEASGFKGALLGLCSPKSPKSSLSNRTAENAAIYTSHDMDKTGETHTALWPYLGMTEDTWDCQEDRVQVAHLSWMSLSLTVSP